MQSTCFSRIILCDLKQDSSIILCDLKQDSSIIFCDLKQDFMSALALNSGLDIPFTGTGAYQQLLGRKAPDPTCNPDPTAVVLQVSLWEHV